MNSISILKKGRGKPNLDDLKTVDEISELAKNRWIVPRAHRRDDYKQWDRSQIRALIRGTVTAAEKPLSANRA